MLYRLHTQICVTDITVNNSEYVQLADDKECFCLVLNSIMDDIFDVQMKCDGPNVALTPLTPLSYIVYYTLNDSTSVWID